MGANHDHLTQAHRARSAADALEREIIPSSGDRQTDIEIAAARVVAVMRLRECAGELEATPLRLPTGGSHA